MAVARALCPTLIGRDADLSELEDGLLAALRGEGSVVVLGGEAGMGKTRLARELERRASSLGCVVISGACSEAELALPYLPFLEAIGNHLATVDTVALGKVLGPAAAELAQLFPQLGAAQTGPGDAVQSKLRLFEAILMLLRTVAGDRGLLLILEDLHWADPATRELLDYMTRRLRGTNVLTLATYRSEELHRKHALLPTIQGWRRAGSVRLVDLDPLDAGAVCDMLCAIFDEENVSDEFAEFMRERGEGNPFVIEEMLKEAIDRGDIYRTDDGWDRKAIRELRVPPTVRDSILLRVERLPADDGAVLSVAAVAGRSFDAELLAAAGGFDPSAVVESLQRCVLHQLLEEDGDSGRFRFRHALTREAIYEDMVTPRRQQLHGRVADELRKRGRPAVELAHHLLLARRDQDAVAMCIEAAAEASRALAYGDAAELLGRALAFIDDPVERARVLCAAADAEWNGARPGHARRLLDEAIPLLEANGLAVEAAGQRVLLGRCLWELQQSEPARREFRAALAVLEPLGPSEALAVTHVRLATDAVVNSNPDRALEEAERAAEVAVAAGSERALAWAWVFEASARIARGEVAAGYERAVAAYDKAFAAGHWFQAQNAVFNMTWTTVHMGDGREAERWVGRIDDFPAHRVEIWGDYMRGLLRLQQGRVEDALRLADAAAEVSEDAGYPKSVWRCQVLRAHVLAELDRGSEAAAVMPPLSSRVDRQDPIYDGTARIMTALADHDPAGALEAARSIAPEDCRFGAPGDGLARVAVTGDPELLLRFAREAPTRGELLRLPRPLAVDGAAALAAGDAERAIDVLGTAAAAFRDGGFLLDAWYTALLLARAQLAAGRSAEAHAVLLEMVAEAATAGARLVARLARELAAEHGLELPAAAAAAATTGAAEPRTGERLVTVLFADIRGYTAASAAAAPADTADRIASLQRWASAAVAVHRGAVDKFAGDAVMATYNLSGASVDHAEHALRSAVEIVQKAAAAGIPVGVGIATGPAIVGRLAPGANVSVLGETTNLAARLQAQSEAGEITLSAESHRRLPEHLALELDFEAVELELKGFTEPVRAYRARAAGPTSPGGRPRPRGGGATGSGAGGTRPPGAASGSP